MRSEKIEVFMTDNGATLAYVLTTRFDDLVYYSPYGDIFYEAHNGGGRGRYSGGNVDEVRHISVPQLSIATKAHRVNQVVEFLDKQFTLVDEVFERDTATIVPLPDKRKIEYLCLADDGTIVYVSASEYKYSYESFRLFVGDGATMRELAVEEVTRKRDGGTTNIDTPEGTFHSPSPFNKGVDGEPASPTWKGWVLKRVPTANFEDYVIVEGEDGSVASITRK